jgi:hypothetical protein
VFGKKLQCLYRECYYSSEGRHSFYQGKLYICSKAPKLRRNEADQKKRLLQLDVIVEQAHLLTRLESR